MERQEPRVVKGFYRSLLPHAAVGAWSSLLDLLFPPLCHSCGVFLPAAGEVKLCETCLVGVCPIESPLCSCCGHPFATEGGMDHLCGRCSLAPPPFHAARAAFRFDKTTRDLIHGFKYGCTVQLRRPLGLLAAARLGEFAAGFAADLLMPVPLHIRRLRQRGFNQSLLLAELFSKRWEIPLCRNNLQRTRWTEPQINLSAAEREANVKGAFSLAKASAVAGKRVLLVDDVYTTGSTVRECSRVLRQEAGAVTAVLTVAITTD